MAEVVCAARQLVVCPAPGAHPMPLVLPHLLAELAALAPSADVKTLSAYAAEFSAEFAPAAVAAPAPAADSE